MQATFTVREMLIAIRIAEGKASPTDLKPEQRKIVQQATEINKG